MLSKQLDRFRKFKQFLGPQVWRLFFVSLVLGVAVFLVESSFVFVLQGFLRAIGLVGEDKLTLPSWYPKSLSVSVLLLLFFGISRGIAYMARFYVNGVTGKAFMRLQRSRISEYALSHIEKIQTHAVIALFGERVSEASGVLQSISQMILVGTSSFLFFAMGLKLAPFEMMIGVVTLAIMLIPFKHFGSKIGDYGEEIRLTWEDINKILWIGLKHNFFFKIYGLLGREVAQNEALLRKHEELCRSYFKVASLKQALPNFIGIFVLSITTYISIRYIHTSGIILLSFFYLFIRLAQGASDVNASFSEFQLHLVGFKELFHWHEALKKDKETSLKIPQMALPKDFFNDGISIAYENVEFQYPENPVLISSLSFKLNRGDVLLLKGESGVGKSTLLMLTIGMLRPTVGEVSINGISVSKVQSQVFDHIAYVGPEPYMIAGTLRENLLFGHQTPELVSDAEMQVAMTQAQLLEKRFTLNLLMDEQTPLSTGQKQRIAIARAILRRPKLLILDEATANLDEMTESNFISSLEPLLPNITTIMISHKSSFDGVATHRLQLYRERSAELTIGPSR